MPMPIDMLPRAVPRPTIPKDCQIVGGTGVIYRLDRRLAEGPLGAVFQAGRSSKGWHAGAMNDDGDRFLVKILFPLQKIAPSHAELQTLEQQFREEAAIDQQTRHPHICPIADVGTMSSSDSPCNCACAFRVSRLPEGEILGARFHQPAGIRLAGEANGSGDPMPLLSTRIQWLLEFASALTFLYENGILRRDVTPSNLFITELGALMLGDFFGTG